MKHLILISAAAMTLAACTTTGSIERNTAFGTAGGAALGAIIGNNSGSGNATKGAAIGAAAGALSGVLAGAYEDRKWRRGDYRPQAQYGAQGYPVQGYQTQGYQTQGYQTQSHVGHGHQQYGVQTASGSFGQQCAPCSADGAHRSGGTQSLGGYVSQSAHSAGGSGGLRYDQFAGRYYSTDPSTGSTYWQNGSLRTRR